MVFLKNMHDMAVKRDICKVSCKVSENLWEYLWTTTWGWGKHSLENTRTTYAGTSDSGYAAALSLQGPKPTFWWHYLKINSGSMAHTLKFLKNFMSTLISRYLRKLNPSWRVGRQTSCPYFPVPTLLFGVFRQASPTNSFFRILKVIEIMKS